MNKQDTPQWDEVFRLIDQRRLIEAVDAVRKMAVQFPSLAMGEVARVEEDYRLMLHYVEMGFNDPERENMYRLFIHRLYRAVANMRTGYRRQKVSVYTEMAQKTGGRLFTHDTIRRELEDFVASKAMLGLESEEVGRQKELELYKQHQAFMAALFCRIIVAPQWSDADEQFYTSLLLSPTIENIDALLVVSAISLATWQEFDSCKMSLLMTLYQKAENVALRQRSLVGWAFAAPLVPQVFDELRQRIATLCADEQVMQELSDMQKQVIFCVDAEKDHDTIQRDIMPTLMKNNNLNITRNGMITEKEDDPMEDILDPDAADRRMEELENTIQKMVNMQKAGSDVYFGGFSPMKRTAFFYDISNWFCPFYQEHPAMAQAVGKVGNTAFLKMLIGHTPLCDSDKYSFLQAIASVVDRLPESVREMMTSGYDGLEEVTIPITDSPEYIRRFYLQDLYRFFRLYHAKNQMRDPFAPAAFLFMANELFPSEGMVLPICDTLRKRNNVEGFKQMVNFCSGQETTEALFVRGIYEYEYAHRYPIAQRCMERLLEQQPDHEKALLYLGRACFQTGSFEKAEESYKKLSEKHPERKSYVLNYCIAMTKNAHFDEALPMLYKLNYQHPDDMNVSRVLAWTLMGMKRLEQAEQEYMKLGDQTADDQLNHAYCRWFAGDMSGAVGLLHTFVASKADGHSLYDEFRRDEQMLNLFNISPTDQALVIDLVVGQ